MSFSFTARGAGSKVWGFVTKAGWRSRRWEQHNQLLRRQQLQSGITHRRQHAQYLEGVTQATSACRLHRSRTRIVRGAWSPARPATLQRRCCTRARRCIGQAGTSRCRIIAHSHHSTSSSAVMHTCMACKIKDTRAPNRSGKWKKTTSNQVSIPGSRGV